MALDLDTLYKTLKAAELATGHPRLVATRRLIDEALTKLEADNQKEVDKIVADQKAKEDDEAKKKAAADLKAAKAAAPEAQPLDLSPEPEAKRDVVGGVPGPAERRI